MVGFCLLPYLQVNIVPLIAKADTISKYDLQKFKCKIMTELVSNGIQIYQFPTDDEPTAQANSSMNVSFFFFYECKLLTIAYQFYFVQK